MPKMKKEIMKQRKRDDDSDDEPKPKKSFMKDGKEKKKIKRKKKFEDSSLSKMTSLKNGNLKKKFKKDLGKNKMKNDRKEKIVSKTQKVHFDPQMRLNANKKDENVLFPCGACGKEVNDHDEAILCEAGCTYWYHRICTGMGNDAYALLTNEDNAEWVCDHCIATKTIPLVRVH